VHANKIREYKQRIADAIVNDCAVIFDKHDEFESVEVVDEFKPISVELPSTRIDPSKLSHLTDEQRKQLLNLLDKYPEVFQDKPGFCSVNC